MNVITRSLLLLAALFWPLLGGVVRGAEPPKTGPDTEKRFPPLKVPAGFKATLFACDPLIEYPSVIAAGPRPGAIFVAVDYMTGLGTDGIRKSEVRLVEDTDGDGYADKATVFAGGFNSIEGITYHAGTVYVMHAPFLTAVRDTKKAGVADERKDLLTGLGLTPEENPVRLHCANGVTAGHDGWLYLALGDHGCNVTRPEGDRLVLEGGGILRCRTDGRDLHIFSTGLRNIYDVALDAELNVFTRDNENDGGDYKIRVCRSFFGADHGYPYHYYERPDEGLSPLADLGLGSSAGGVYYLETQFPAEYRGNLFFCEWGKSLVRYQLKRAGSSFATPAEIEMATSAENDPYGFKPTDVVVQQDGTLMVADYADGQRPKRGRGRIYHIRYVGDGDGQQPHADERANPDRTRLFAELDSPSYAIRCRAQAALAEGGEDVARALEESLLKGNLLGERAKLHAVWALAFLRGEDARETLLQIAASDGPTGLRIQAIRAVADMTDPVLAQHKLAAERGSDKVAARLAEAGKGASLPVLLEIIVALARLRWAGAPEWLKANLKESDSHLAHAAMRALRRSENWPAVLKLLDAPSSDPLRAIALRAIAEQFEPAVVDGLIERLKGEKEASRRREFADALTRVYKQRGPWVYWDYRPKPRPANTVAWEKTEAIGAALDRTLADPDPAVRLAVLRRMQRENIPVSLPAIGKWLEQEHEPETVAALLASLRDQPTAEVRQHLTAVIREPKQSAANRLVALEMFSAGLEAAAAEELLLLAKRLEDGPVLADALRRTAKLSKQSAAPFLAGKLKSKHSEVRAAAIESLGNLKAPEAREPLLALLSDNDPEVRRAAAAAAGKLEERRAIEPLLRLAADRDLLVRAASLGSLRLLKEPRALPLAVAALGERQTELVGLQCLRELGGPEQAGAVADLAKRNPSTDVLTAAVQMLTAWRNRQGTSTAQQEELDRTVAEIHGASGSLIRWTADMGHLFASGTEGRVSAANGETAIAVAEPTAVEFLASSSGSLEVSLNGKSIYRRDQAQAFRIDSDRFAATLAKGENRLLVQVGNSTTPLEFHLRFRRKSATQAHEKLIAAALARSGNIERGQKVFQNVEKSNCLKCHRVGDQGEKTGPELTGLGSRFSRIYIAESILDPSRTIAPSFGTMVVRLESGLVLSGIKVVETETMLTLVDNQAQKHMVARSEIEEQKTSPLSTMPEGLEKKLTEDEFVDLVAFLASLKENRMP